MLRTLQAALDDAGMLSKEFDDSVRKRPNEEPTLGTGKKNCCGGFPESCFAAFDGLRRRGYSRAISSRSPS